MPYNACYSYNIKQDEEISFPITVNKVGQKMTEQSQNWRKPFLFLSAITLSQIYKDTCDSSATLSNA